MTHAEVLTTAIVAVRFFSGNFQNACNFLSEHDYILKMLSKSRFNRRLHKLGPELIGDVQKIIGEIFKSLNTDQEYAVDSFPVPVCENIRIFHSKIYTEEKYRGYQASKKRYFYGIKVHMVETAFSGIARLFPKHIHAVTAKGCELKVALFSCIPSFMVLTEVILI